MSFAYATTNLCSGLAAAAFTWSSGTAGATRSRLNDTKMSALYVNGASVASGINVVIDFGSAVALTGFAICNSNAAVQKTNATLKVESADDAGISVNNVVRKAASTLNSALFYNKDHVVQFSTGTARRYWRLTWTWTGNVADFAIGEIFAFNAQTVLSRKSIYGDGEAPEFKTASVEFYSGGGCAYFQGGPIRLKNLPFSDLSTSDRDELLTMWAATKGPATPFLFIPSYEATATAAAVAEQEVVFGQLMVDKFSWTQPDFNLFDPTQLVIRSLGREIGA